MDAQGLQKRLEVAVAIARRMSAEALARQPAGRAGTSLKGHQDYLTEVDGAIERMIKSALAEAFPGDSFLGEEFGGGTARSLWVVDPIDGTANFARGGHFWCISIAHMTDGIGDVGVVAAPVLGRIYAARTGGGATCNGIPIRVSQVTKPGEAVIELDWTPSLSRPDFLRSVDRLLEAGFEFRRSGACALALALVAHGVSDGFAESFTKPWDALAGCVLVREAGGTTSDFEHRLLERMGNPVVAAGPALYPALSAASGFVTG